MTHHLKNSSGFITVFYLLLLPTIICLGIYFYYMTHLLWLRSETRLHCRQALLAGQSGVIISLRILLAQNPKALLLRTQLQLAQEELAAATAASNPIAIAYATQKISRIISKQQQLENLQKKHIKLAEKNMRLGVEQAETAINEDMKKRQTLGFVDFWKLIITSPLVLQRPSLAVRAQLVGLAPPYELQPQFQKRQTISYQWSYEIHLPSLLWTGSSVKWTRSPLKMSFDFHDSCSATLTGGYGRWQSTLTKDKYSSN